MSCHCSCVCMSSCVLAFWANKWWWWWWRLHACRANAVHLGVLRDSRGPVNIHGKVVIGKPRWLKMPYIAPTATASQCGCIAVRATSSNYRTCFSGISRCHQMSDTSCEQCDHIGLWGSTSFVLRTLILYSPLPVSEKAIDCACTHYWTGVVVA